MEPNVANLVYFIIGGVVLVSLVSIVGGFLHVRRGRLLDQQGRMKALELGRAMPGDAAREDEDRSPARKCFSTTLWIAFWGFLAAGESGMRAGHHVVAISVAAAVGAVGVAGMICGTILALRAPAPPAPGPFSKHVMDPDGP
jgi:hypothetical protein